MKSASCLNVLTKIPVIQKRTIGEKIYNRIRSKSFIILAIELSLGYLLMEFLNQITNTSIQFKYIDFRLLYVVIIAAVHGLKPGIMASVLSCISCLAAYIASGTQAAMIVYSIDKWLPFSCYIMLGAVIGYTKDKKEKQISSTTDENITLKKRYSFLIELYDNSLTDKDEYKRQIMSYKNSFGRIYEITRKLNSMLPVTVFKEALLALEDILGNQTIAIYNISGETKFARLSVCSKKIMEATPKSINLTVYNKAISQMKKDTVWTNYDRLIGYPIIYSRSITKTHWFRLL